MRFQNNDMTGAVSEGGAAVRVAAASMHEPAFVAAGHLKRASVYIEFKSSQFSATHFSSTQLNPDQLRFTHINSTRLT